MSCASYDLWTEQGGEFQNTYARVSSWRTTPDDRHYPSEKLVYDSMFVHGVISQTQTWSGSDSQPRTYVMSDQVWGAIPQANIDLFEAAGATFNAVTGYFELNGLTDISYEEMKVIERYKGLFDAVSRVGGSGCFRGLSSSLRTTTRFNNVSAVNLGYGFFGNGEIEVIGADDFTLSGVGSAFMSCPKLKGFAGVIKFNSSVTNTSNVFAGAYSLQDVQISGLNANISFANSPNLSKDSLLYMINNASTTAFTITLHATVYAKCQSGGDWYSEVSAALSVHTNITLASA